MKGKIIIVLSAILLLCCQFANAHYSYRVQPIPHKTISKTVKVSYPYKGQPVSHYSTRKSVKVACGTSTCGVPSNNCGGDSCSTMEGCGWGGVKDGACGDCNCTDLNCGRNPCISARKCCEVFGNIGDGDLGEFSTGCG